MKSSNFNRSVTFGALAVLGCVSFSCKDSGNAAYDGGFKPDAVVNGVPSSVLQSGADTALTGLGLGQDTLKDATTAVKLGESDNLEAPTLDASQLAATAAPERGLTGGGSVAGGVTGSGSPGSSDRPGSNGSGSLGLGGSNGSRGSGNSAGGSGGAGSLGGGGFSSLGDIRTSAIVDPSKLGPRGDGTMDATDVLGQSKGSDGTYAAAGAGKSSGGSGVNPFAALLGEGNGGGVGSGGAGGGGAGASEVEFGRSPASTAGQGDAAHNGSGPMGSQDPANYFTLLNTNDNLFKIVERRYASKSRQWAISDAQEIRRSVSR